MGGEFDRCLGGVGNLNRKYLVFPVLRNTHVVFSLLAMEEFRGEDCTFVSEWLMKKGLQKLCSVFEGRYNMLPHSILICKYS